VLLLSGGLLLVKYLNNPWVKDLSFNFNDAIVKWLDLCFVGDTVQGILVMNGVISLLETMYPEGSDFHDTVDTIKVLAIIFGLCTYIMDIVDFT